MTGLIRRSSLVTAAAVAMTFAWQTPMRAESRLKDIVTLQGIGAAPLVGYGLVVGLNKTGDKRQTIFSAQTLANMLSRFGVTVLADQMKVENVAAVVVTAEMSPYSRVGGRVDVVASSIGDARSLQGGTLLPTPLRGSNGDMVALAQGPRRAVEGGAADRTPVFVHQPPGGDCLLYTSPSPRDS